MTQKIPKLFYWICGALLLINLIQAHFTQLIYDEAYYWYYAQDMAWGYFDHPPMVALMIKIGSVLFPGELGVRFMGCVLSVGMLFVLWAMVDHPKKKAFVPHFFVLALSMTLLHAYGFLTLPDTPLLFFTAVFLYVYQKFIKTPSALLGLGLGLSMAALMYSKYHAVLVIITVLASNLSLLRNRYAWLAVGVSLLAYFPHFWWLYTHDFVSVKYHLFERPNRPYDFAEYTLGYLVNLVAIFGLTFPWIYWALFKARPTDKFKRALIFLVYGVLLFFFVSSFNRRIQTQWIIVISVPMVVLAFQAMLDHTTIRKWIFRAGLANVVILSFLRIGLIYRPLFPITYETHGNKEWVADLRSKVGDTPVVFENSYRRAPMYSFYSGIPSFSLNNIFYRKNQYSIDGSEELMRHKRVVYITKYASSGDISYTSPEGSVFWGHYIDDFESFRKLQCIVPTKNGSIPKSSVGDTLTLKVYNPYKEGIPLSKLRFASVLMDPYKKVLSSPDVKPLPAHDGTTALAAKDTTSFTFVLPKQLPEGVGYFKICIAENGLPLGLNGEKVKLE